MVTLLRGWLMSVIAASLVLSLLNSLLPEGTVRTVARMTGGLILLLVLLRPLTNLDLSELNLSYGDCTQRINEQISGYQQENEVQMRTLIEEKTGAYIQDKAKQLGLACFLAVTAEEKDGIVTPVSVTLDIARNQALSDYMTSELGISSENQHWLPEG